ncbi:hypothetical protein BDR22DRAFT_816768 [Usnea florida]
MCPAILVSAFLFSSLVSAAILTTYSPANLLPPLPPPLLSLSQNATNTTTLTPNGIRFQCDGNYGRIANPSSCLDLFEYVATSDAQATFSDRHTGHPSDVPLPWRVSGSSGLCFLQALLVAGAASGHASSKQVGQAGYVVFQRCVVERGIGGIAENVGGDNKLNVVIASYEPRVRCDRTAVKGPPWESCLLIGLDMEASKERMVFGNKAADPRVQVNLPMVYKAIDARCQLKVDISGKSTSVTWYEIWEATIALSTMCVRTQGKGGKAFGMGLRKNIFIEISDENPDFSQTNATIANVSAQAALWGLEGVNASIEAE